MSLAEIEFDLSAQQFEWMGYPLLRQGQSLDVQVESSVLLPEAGAESWYAVQKEPLADQLQQVGRGVYAFAGQISQAELLKDADGMATATLLVRCGVAPVRVLCAPQADGLLPEGTWETRYLAGVSRLHGLVEEDFSTAVGERIGVILWGFRRLVLTPGDAAFGRWVETDELLPAPYVYDRVVVTARIHRATI
jgi:hypothetical protein